MTARDRFMAKVSPEPNTGCWLWAGAMHGGNARAYGEFWPDSHRRGMVYTHRFAYEEVVGPIPEGMCVLHRCDTPSCVNPAHLFLGTQGDNNRDMGAKGRGRGWSRPGEANPASKLTAEKVAELRARAACGDSQYALAAAYGVAQATVNYAVLRRTWKDAP